MHLFSKGHNKNMDVSAFNIEENVQCVTYFVQTQSITTIMSNIQTV